MDLWPGLFAFASRWRHRAMTTAVDYRQYADECLKAIWLARMPEIRALLLSMAKRWLELAEQAERDPHHRMQAEANLEPAGGKKQPARSITRRLTRANWAGRDSPFRR